LVNWLGQHFCTFHEFFIIIQIQLGRYTPPPPSAADAVDAPFALLRICPWPWFGIAEEQEKYN
jgi:hypothetical protein